MTDSTIATALARAEILAAIAAIERYSDELTDLGCDKYLKIQHRLIKELEEKL